MYINKETLSQINMKIHHIQQQILLSESDIRLVLFDLDGTLVDSAPDIAWCGDEMLRVMNLPARGIESSRLWVGNGIEKFVKRALTNKMQAEPRTDLYRQGLEIFKTLYAEHNCVHSQLYPSVIEGLDKFKELDINIACVTNKAELFTNSLLEKIGLKPYFDLVVSGDTTAKKKPDPLPLQYAAEHFQLSPESCLIVGDSSNDVNAGRAAGFTVACVPYGYNHGEDITDSHPDYLINNIKHLADMFVDTGT
jgi:phosphoglycolate phosphatase